MKVKKMVLSQYPSGGFENYRKYKKFDYWVKLLSLN